ncbi:uncharacterized protein LOC125281988 isoform X1 [Ursus arctos]|uniref:uncharacterized protein LOC125281988 isoform X1 n=1 Tax=Ursus arctos TaxID=9644 RepID=UPI0020170925|nr:uncharacterized protein LOC125281988 isoform X1 [Ursus arctos]
MASQAVGKRRKGGKPEGARRLWEPGCGAGRRGQLVVPRFLLSWSFWALEAYEGSSEGDPHGWQGKTLPLAICYLCLPPFDYAAWCGHCGSIQPSESPAPPSEPVPASALTLLLSRLFCVLVLGFGVSTSASLCLSLCLCPCLCLFSLLLLAPVDIKVIKDLPWPLPVGQLDRSCSLPDGDRDISGPASPLPEPSLEDGSAQFEGSEKSCLSPGREEKGRLPPRLSAGNPKSAKPLNVEPSSPLGEWTDPTSPLENQLVPRGHQWNRCRERAPDVQRGQLPGVRQQDQQERFLPVPQLRVTEHLLCAEPCIHRLQTNCRPGR